MEIREASADDVMRLLSLADASPQAAHWGAGKYLERITAASGLVILAVEGDEIAGFVVARITAPECEIENLAVMPRLQRRGYGRALVRSVIGAARQAACEAIWLEVRESNQAARRLYAACGFSPIVRRIRYYSEPVEDAILLRRTL
ncbi:MAG: ribosomal protein S18-alanine N-acetyltransferase [Acidobacteria bacterium]|nr:ribosomal protein S18-alanine N-acetyltransferase [Acidobacteriota bacterium]